MRSNPKRPTLLFLAISSILILGLGIPLAAEPVLGKDAPEPAKLAKPSELTKKTERSVIKGIDNSECLGCHGDKIIERKFAQSVHGANSCNSCHWDITDLEAHERAKKTGAVSCNRCHKKEAAEYASSAHFINDVQCKDCHKDIHEMILGKVIRPEWSRSVLPVTLTMVTQRVSTAHPPSQGIPIPPPARIAMVSTRFLY